MKPRFFDLAKKLSYRSDHQQHRLGCVIVKKNRVISVGWNVLKTHTQSPHPYRSIHAEFSAIIGVDKRELKGSDVYVYRENKNGTPALARPCIHCYKCLQQVGVEKIYYTTTDGYKDELI